MRYNVIYARYSSEMQRSESCDDQVRDVKRDLPRYDVDPADAIVLRDEAQSGTKTVRAGGYEKLCAMVQRREVGVLAVDDQSRLGRGDNVFGFVKDLIFNGGRFISTGEGIDTNQAGWELRVKVMQLHNSQTICELAHRVRRGQEGRVLEDGSAGDYPLGYESYYLDSDWAEQLQRRGPKPKKGLRIHHDHALIVRQIFNWFVEGKSMGWIARQLTRQAAPKDHRGTTTVWHHEQVRRILNNAKYVGRWRWGMSTTIRDSQGRIKQVPVPESDQVVRERPQLRIIDDETWDKAQERLRSQLETHGYKEGQKKRGPKVQAGGRTPRSLLGGVLVCGVCGDVLWFGGTDRRRFYACAGHRKGLCDVALQVPAAKAEAALLEFLSDLLRAWPEWLDRLYARIGGIVRERFLKVPQKLQQERQQLENAERQIMNLVNALAEGLKNSTAVKMKLEALEREKTLLEQSIEAGECVGRITPALPEKSWVFDQMKQLQKVIANDPDSAARVMREAFDVIRAHPVIAPGKKRGFAQLRFCVRGWALLAEALGENVDPSITANLMSLESTSSPEFVLDLGEPTQLDKWAPQIASWRDQGMLWKEIVERTGLDLNRVYRAYKRYRQSQEQEE